VARGGGQPPPWEIDEHATDCAALIEAVCDPPVSLVGLSMGSLIAVQPHDRPDLVARAIVIGTCERKTGFIRGAPVPRRRRRASPAVEVVDPHVGNGLPLSSCSTGGVAVKDSL
jgi:pimeloyl-ACP methyl ester carboxylesterase